MENVRQHQAFIRRRSETCRLSVCAAVVIASVLIPGTCQVARGQSYSTFQAPTITADYLKLLRQQVQQYDEERNLPTDPKDDVSSGARRRAEDYARSLFDFSRTQAAQPRQYTTYDEINRPSLFPGATSDPQTTLSSWNYEDYYANSLRNDPKYTSGAGSLIADRSTFNPYEDLQENQQGEPYRDLIQAGASAGRFGAQTIRLQARPLERRLQSARGELHDNLNLGLLKGRAGAIAGLTYTDNATFQSGKDQMSDLIGQVAVKFAGRQQVTKDNAISFQIGLGYTEYLLNPELNDLIQAAGPDLNISPTSSLAWETSIGDVFFTLFNSLGVSQRIEDDFNAEAEANYTNYTHTIGAAASWQATRTTSFTASVGRTNRKAIESQFSSNDLVAYNIIGDIEYSPGQSWIAGRNQIWVPSNQQSWVAGLSTSLSKNEREGGSNSLGTNSPRNESTTISVGPYFTTPISRFTRIRLAGGMQFAKFEQEVEGTTTGDEPYYSLDVVNQLNRFTSQSFRIGHESGLNDITNALTADFVRHSFAFTVSPRTALQTTVYYEHQEDRFGSEQQDLDRTGWNLNLQHRLNSDVTLYLGYNYGKSDSTLISGTGGTIRDPNDPTQIRNSPGTDFTQETFNFDISFPFAREIDLILGYRHLKVVSSDPGGNFVENRGSINFSYNF